MMAENYITRFRNKPKSEVDNAQLSRIQEQRSRESVVTSDKN
jgi:hypothetical protein